MLFQQLKRSHPDPCQLQLGASALGSFLVVVAAVLWPRC